MIGKEWSSDLHRIQIAPFTETPGPVHQLGPDTMPLHIFNLFWEPSFFERLATETNLYAEQRQTSKPDVKWYPTTPEEMKAFVGVNMIMGIDQKPELCNYWSTDEFLGNVGIQRVFTRDRFESLCRYLHMNDSQQQPARDDPSHDALYKVRPLLTMCERTFLEQYVPDRDLSIDEAMVKYKGRVFFRQYLPKKPVKWGIKVWMLAESKTGYVSNFEVYLGKAPPSDRAGQALGTRVVMDISKPFHQSNHHLYFDNFFNSQELMEELLRAGTYGCGTLRANRYPPPFKVGRASIKLKPGEIRQLQKGHQLLTVWFDKRQVAVLSSNSNPNETVTVQRRSKQPPHVRDTSIPAPIRSYNQSMGGVDLSDQIRSYDPSGRSGKKWWRYFFGSCWMSRSSTP